MGKIKARENIDIAEVSERLSKIAMLCNNLCLLRLGIINSEVTPCEKVIDDAIYIVEEGIESLVEQIDDLLYTEE